MNELPILGSINHYLILNFKYFFHLKNQSIEPDY